MYQLTNIPEPAWLDILPGVRVRLKFLGSAGMAAARGAASRLPEGATEDDRAHAFTIAAACWGATEWEGVGDAQGAVLPLSKEALAALLRKETPAYDSVDLGYVVPALLRDAEKNGSSPSQTGTSTAAKPTARPARKPAKRARRS
jgi:hypothetical protein